MLPSNQSTLISTNLHGGADLALERCDMVTAKMPDNLNDAREILTVDEAAHLMRVGRHAMYEAIRRGEVETLRFGRRLLIKKTTLQRLLSIATDDGKEAPCEVL
jgi:excisionase family DNA binding protein